MNGWFSGDLFLEKATSTACIVGGWIKRHSPLNSPKIDQVQVMILIFSSYYCFPSVHNCTVKGWIEHLYSHGNRASLHKNELIDQRPDENANIALQSKAFGLILIRSNINIQYLQHDMTDGDFQSLLNGGVGKQWLRESTVVQNW